ncbi:alpha/beta hydrolase-fold protein [Carboxylicivirga linearis]|uniref:Esterase n=1 Tax=Carboxylicivirga linearis TaxID=1628157 RepID=A0ABS5JWE5_9BACT|nr:alpha/beta hydrolase-fold protein [Carboxylicivirga linearis]MBS2098799.1 hypothetical protein [Carboxylicivirga linearis]
MNRVSLTFFLLLIVFSAVGQTVGKDITIGQSIEYKSNILNRSVQVFLSHPDDFQTHPYPLAILLSAEPFDFRASILKNEFVTVGIESVDGKKDFLKEEGRKKYLTFILEELLPDMERQYKTSGVRMVSGHSMAGAMVLECFLNKPDHFSFYLATSPVLQLVDAKHINKIELKQNKALYFGMGRNENYPQLEQSNHAFHFLLDSLQIDYLHWKFDVLKDETHQTNAYTGFCKGYNFYRSFTTVPDSILGKNITEVQDFVSQVKEQMGISISIDENVLMPHLLLNLSNENYANVAESIKFISANNPELFKREMEIMLELAKQLRIKGGREMAYYTYQLIYDQTGSDEAKRNLEELKQGY